MTTGTNHRSGEQRALLSSNNNTTTRNNRPPPPPPPAVKVPDPYEERRRLRQRRRCICATLWSMLFASLVGCIWVVFRAAQQKHQALVTNNIPYQQQPLLNGIKSSKNVHRGCESTVLIMRHCEKYGPDIKDVIHNQHCSYVGLERARYLKTLFSKRWPRPHYLYAMSPNRTGHLNYREIETLLPLSEKVMVEIDSQYLEEHEDDLAADVFDKLRGGDMCGKVAVISWGHAQIPILARALGCGVDQGCPAEYSEDEFDEVWQLKYVYGPPIMYPPDEEVVPGGSVRRGLKKKAKNMWFVYGSKSWMQFDPLHFSFVNGDYPEEGTPMGGRWASPYNGAE